MKTIISAAVVALIMTSTANAQQDSCKHNMQHHPQFSIGGNDGKGFKQNGQDHFKGGPGRYEYGKDQFAQRVKLTDDQRKQSKVIRDNTENQIVNLYNNDKLTLGDYKKKKATIMQDQKTKLDGILTVDQKIRMAEGKKKMLKNAQVQGAARLERMKIDLGLKDEQVATIKASQAQMRDKVKAIHEDAVLLPEQKREQMKALMDQQKESLKTVLTTEQLAKLESLKKPWDTRR